MKKLIVALTFLIPSLSFANQELNEITVLPLLLLKVAKQQNITDTYINKIAVQSWVTKREVKPFEPYERVTEINLHVKIASSNGTSVYTQCVTDVTARAYLLNPVFAFPTVKILSLNRNCPNQRPGQSDENSFSLRSFASILGQASVREALKDNFRLEITSSSMPIIKEGDDWNAPRKKWRYNLRIESIFANEQIYGACAIQSISADTTLRDDGQVVSVINKISEAKTGAALICPN